MSDVYEYRRGPSKGPIWLAFIGVVLLLVAVIQYDADHLMWLVWASAAVMIAWMLLPQPVAGIQVDDDTLSLAAWRQPRAIPLDDIAHLRYSGTNLTNGRSVFESNHPRTGYHHMTIRVMAKRGIPVRDVS